MNIASKEDLKAELQHKGKIGLVTLDELTFGVVIKDVRFRFGHLDYLVEPLNGTGTKWVENHKVQLRS